MENLIEPQQRKELIGIGRDFAIEGLTWENYKPVFNQPGLREEEKRLFLEGYAEGLHLVCESLNTENKKTEVTRSL